MGLEKKRILLTRPQEQNIEWSEKLKKLQAKPISFPLIEIKPIFHSPEINLALQNLGTYQWIIFSSANATACFHEILLINGIRKLKMSIAALGTKTAEFLHSKAYAINFVPAKFTSAKLAETIPDIKGKRILVPRTDIADDALYLGLTARGAIVDEIVVYETKKVTGKQKELQDIVDRGVDVITFASPSAVEVYFEMGINGHAAAFACIGPTTAKRLIELGKTADIVAETYTTEGITEAMEIYFASK